MLKDLDVNQARFVALLAKAARVQRDDLLGNVSEEEIAELKAARGEHNPIAALGFDLLRPRASPTEMLKEAIETLSPQARSELYTIVRIGQGDLAANKWHRGLSEAALLGDHTITGAILENPDLHDQVMKGLYEAKLAT